MTNRTAAIRYARALLDVAVKEKADVRRIEEQLAGFVDLLKQYPALEQVLLNPVIAVQRKRAAVEELTKKIKLEPILAKLLLLLAGRDRLVLLPDLLASYRERLFDHLKIVRAEVITAAPLLAGRAKAVEKTLAAISGRAVTVDTRVDPAIIGGLVARVGSTVYDGSVTRQLQRMRARLEEGAGS